MNFENHNFSYFLKERKNEYINRKVYYQFRTGISTVVRSWDSPMYAFPPSTVQRNHSKNASAETHAFHKTSLTPWKSPHVD